MMTGSRFSVPRGHDNPPQNWPGEVSRGIAVSGRPMHGRNEAMPGSYEQESRRQLGFGSETTSAISQSGGCKCSNRVTVAD